jgi:U-box domain
MVKKVNNFVLVLLVSAVGLSVNAADFSEDGQPDELLCPIAREVMVNPVFTADGHTYERDQIEEWFRSCDRRGVAVTSPKTGSPLASRVLTPNHALKSLIESQRPPLSNGNSGGSPGGASPVSMNPSPVLVEDDGDAYYASCGSWFR